MTISEPMHYIQNYESSLGKIILASDGTCLTGLWFEGQKYDREGITGLCQEENLLIFDQTCQWLNLYFEGKEPEYTPPIQIKTTEFRKLVWEILLTIHYGETMTYGEIAEELTRRQGYGKMSARAVGGAVSHNAISIIIPCHRVVGAKGQITGYAGGIDRKMKLLSLEKR